MKFKNVLIVVKDIERSRRFYHDLFGLEMILDNDGNMILTEGLVLQEEKYWTEFLGREIVPENNSFELYFEESNIEGFIEKLEKYYPDVKYVNRLMTHSWGQKVIRFYDPDGNLIEVGHRFNMANIITGIRIICSIALMFCPVFSPAFYALYITAGISDMIDGFVARKTGTVSAFGSKLDTVADFVFVVVCLIKLIPAIQAPTWLIIWIIVIAVIKVINLISGYVMRKEMVSLHTKMNKATGILLFVLPLTLAFVDLKYSGVFVSAVAAFAAIQEGVLIRKGEI